MPNILDHPSSTITKLGLVADSGGGKSGSLLSLASEGYNVRIIDCDNGLDCVAEILRGPNPYKPDTYTRIAYKTITERRTPRNGKLLPGANVWTDVSNMLDNFDDGKVKYGSIYRWTSQEILVVDSFSFLAKGALNWILSMNGRLGQQPHQSDYFFAQGILEDFLAALFSDHVKCNVIVMFHIQTIRKDGIDHAYPEGCGSALSPKIGRYFNNILMVRSTGSGNTAKRTLHTKNCPGLSVELKNSSPLTVKDSYPQDTGLAQYFADLRKGVPKAPVPPVAEARA